MCFPFCLKDAENISERHSSNTEWFWKLPRYSNHCGTIKWNLGDRETGKLRLYASSGCTTNLLEHVQTHWITLNKMFFASTFAYRLRIYGKWSRPDMPLDVTAFTNILGSLFFRLWKLSHDESRKPMLGMSGNMYHRASLFKLYWNLWLLSWCFCFSSCFGICVERWSWSYHDSTNKELVKTVQTSCMFLSASLPNADFHIA